MAKSVAVGKRLKIDKAQKNMFSAVAVASLILGISLVLSVYFLKYIKYNSAIIGAQGKVVSGYSDAIRDIGICTKPSKATYNMEEINACDPNNPDILKNVVGTLRYNVLVELAQNEALESVGRKSIPSCYDTSLGQKRSYEELLSGYRYATKDADKENYLKLIVMCSALRVVPDALPSGRNSTALGASLNQIFNISRYSPKDVTPGETVESEYSGIEAIGLNFTIESSADTVMRVLDNMERSIREINLKTMSIESVASDDLVVNIDGSAYYTLPATLNEALIVVHGDGTVEEQAGSEEEVL